MARNQLLGPRLEALGRVLDANPTTVGTIVLRNEKEAAAAERLAREGYEFAKPYNDLAPQVYRAFVREAGRHRLIVAGHLPVALDAAEAAALNQRSIEHLTNLWFEVATAEDDIRDRIRQAVARAATPEALFRLKIDTLFRLAFSTYSADKERALFDAFATSGTWQVPTLVVDRHYARRAAPLATRAELRLLPPWVIRSGEPLDALLESLTAEQRETLAELYRREAAMVGRRHRAGVGILAGSDAPLAYLAPGAALHHELEALVHDSGLTPVEALRTATINPGRYFGRSDIGQLRPGAPADIVLLEGDPTADIRHTRRIRAVVRNGRYFDRAALDRLLAGVRESSR